MKKILCLALLVGFAYSQTGNEFLKNYPFDKKIDEMNILIKDIKVGKVKPNMGEMYYKKMGYSLPENLTKNYLEFPEKGNTSKLIVKKTKLSSLIGKKYK